MSGTRGALLLSRTQASVAEFRRKTLAPDEVQVSARARFEPVPLLHEWEGSGAASATEFHAKR
jgi:hypothetical protein